jgi:PAS domain S-box-containing protein
MNGERDTPAPVGDEVPSSAQLRLESIVQSAMDAIITIDEAQRIVLFNRAAEDMFLCKAEDVLHQSLGRFIPERFRKQHRVHIENFGKSGVTSRKMGALGVISGLRSNGEEFPAEAAISQVGIADARFYTVILRDITQRKRLQEQLRRTERVAELGTLASGMAHEIGTPMNVILGRAEYLMSRTTDETTRKGLQTIISQVERITKVMNQLLSFARRRAPERRAVALSGVIESGLEMFHERLARRRIEIETDCGDACLPVHADADQMSQVLINLLMNAIDAMPDGGQVRIRIRPVEPDVVEWTIMDTGSGMSSDVLEKVFDPFFTTKEFGAGTGLGLTVVKGIMDEHGGSISAESEPGKGTTFKMILPRSEQGSR